MKLNIGDRVAIWDAPDGRGTVIGGPDEAGNFLVEWDAAFDGPNEPSWEGVDVSMKIGEAK